MPLPQKGQKAERKSWRDFLYLLAHILANPSTTRTVNDFKKLITSQRLQKADNQSTAKEKKRRQGLQLIRTRREEALREMEGTTYEAGDFRFPSRQKN